VFALPWAKNAAHVQNIGRSEHARSITVPGVVRSKSPTILRRSGLCIAEEPLILGGPFRVDRHHSTRVQSRRQAAEDQLVTRGRKHDPLQTTPRLLRAPLFTMLHGTSATSLPANLGQATQLFG